MKTEVSDPQDGVRVAVMTEEMDIKQVLDVMMDRFLAHTKQLVNFAKRSPGKNESTFFTNRTNLASQHCRFSTKLLQTRQV